MLSFRPKLGTERNSEWRCCFCLHVRTGTILLGTWHLMLHLVALGFLAAIVRDPRLLDEFERDSAPLADWGTGHEAMSTAHSKIQLMSDGQSRDHSLIYHDVDVGALLTVCTLAITFMLIYGAALGKAAHLLPFFCLQIFDFAITVLTATGYLCYLRSIHRLVAETRRVPWRAELLQLPAPLLALIVLSAFLLAVVVKGYCISVVWRCYKYLTMRAHALRAPFVIATDEGPHVAAADYCGALPDYEQALKQTPPPSYHVATLLAAHDTSTTCQERVQPEPVQPLQPTNTVVILPNQGGAQANL